MGELRGEGDLVLSPVEESIAADLRAAFLVEPDPVTTDRHVAAMVAASEARRAPSVIALATHRSRKALVAAGVAGVVLLGSAGVAAASGNLPDPLQRAVASACRPVGIVLPVPGGEENKSGPPADEPTTVPPTSATSAAPTTVAPGSVPPGGVQSDGGSGSQSPNSGDSGNDPRTTPTTRPTDDHRGGGGSGGDGRGGQNKDGTGGGSGGGGSGGGGGRSGGGHGGG